MFPFNLPEIYEEFSKCRLSDLVTSDFYEEIFVHLELALILTPVRRLSPGSTVSSQLLPV